MSKLTIYILGALLLLNGCGGRGKSVNFQPSPVSPVSDGNGPPADDGTETGRVAACTLSFRAVIQPLSVAPLLINTPIRFRVSAEYCPGNEFSIDLPNQNQRFTTSKEIELTYTAAGSKVENFFIRAYENSQSTAVKDIQIVSQSFSVTDPVQPPRPEPAPSCMITRVPNNPVTTATAPLVIRIDTLGTVTDLKLNNLPAVAGTPLNLLPLGSGFYSATAVVTGPGGVSSCGFVFQTPSCQHQFVSAVLDPNTGLTTLTTNTQLYGSYDSVVVNDVAIGSNLYPVPPQTQLTTVNPSVAFVSGSRVSSVTVQNQYGDSSICSATYTQPTFDISVSSVGVKEYNWYAGVVTSGAANRVMIGAGGGDDPDKIGRKGQVAYWRMQEGEVTMSVLLEPAAAVTRDKNCSIDEVVVGRFNVLETGVRGDDAERTLAMNTLLCRKLRPYLTLSSPSTHTVTWGYNVSIGCPANKVMIGNAYVGANSFSIYCAQIVAR